MRKFIFAILCLGLVALVGLLVGCGGTSMPGFEVIPASEDVVGKRGVGDEWRYVDRGDRLVFMTTAPTPTPTPWPSRELVGRAGGRSGPELPEGAIRGVGVIPGREAEGVSAPEGLGCVEHYRWLLKGYWGRRPFGPETAALLSEKLKGERADCVAEGWSPEFSLEAVCRTGTVAGTEISSRLVRREGSMRQRRALSSGKDGNGNILVQFEKLPLSDGRGCWYFKAGKGRWSWVVLGEKSGIDAPRFPVCEARLKEKVLAGDVENLRVIDVAAAVDRVKFEFGAECGTGNWDIYPGSGGSEVCSVAAETGYQDGGVLVVNWQEEHPASDGAVCWVHDLGSGQWESSYPEVD